ncbi:MAG: hypothetical protein ACRYGK_11745, partial [Janthinobacterium lividum]
PHAPPRVFLTSPIAPALAARPRLPAQPAAPGRANMPLGAEQPPSKSMWPIPGPGLPYLGATQQRPRGMAKIVQPPEHATPLDLVKHRQAYDAHSIERCESQGYYTQAREMLEAYSATERRLPPQFQSESNAREANDRSVLHGKLLALEWISCMSAMTANPTLQRLGNAAVISFQAGDPELMEQARQEYQAILKNPRAIGRTAEERACFEYVRAVLLRAGKLVEDEVPAPLPGKPMFDASTGQGFRVLRYLDRMHVMLYQLQHTREKITPEQINALRVWSHYAAKHANTPVGSREAWKLYEDILNRTKEIETLPPAPARAAVDTLCKEFLDTVQRMGGQLKSETRPAYAGIINNYQKQSFKEITTLEKQGQFERALELTNEFLDDEQHMSVDQRLPNAELKKFIEKKIHLTDLTRARQQTEEPLQQAILESLMNVIGPLEQQGRPDKALKVLAKFLDEARSTRMMYAYSPELVEILQEKQTELEQQRTQIFMQRPRYSDRADSASTPVRRGPIGAQPGADVDTGEMPRRVERRPGTASTRTPAPVLSRQPTPVPAPAVAPAYVPVPASPRLAPFMDFMKVPYVARSAPATLALLRRYGAQDEAAMPDLPFGIPRTASAPPPQMHFGMPPSVLPARSPSRAGSPAAPTPSTSPMSSTPPTQQAPAPRHLNRTTEGNSRANPGANSGTRASVKAKPLVNANNILGDMLDELRQLKRNGNWRLASDMLEQFWQQHSNAVSVSSLQRFLRERTEVSTVLNRTDDGYLQTLWQSAAEAGPDLIPERPRTTNRQRHGHTLADLEFLEARGTPRQCADLVSAYLQFNDGRVAAERISDRARQQLIEKGQRFERMAAVDKQPDVISQKGTPRARIPGTVAG